MAISIRERIRKKGYFIRNFIVRGNGISLVSFFRCFFERKREQQKWREKLVPFSYLSGVKKKKEKKGERKGMREKVTSSRVSRIVQILENKILSLLYATTIIFMQLEI